jgi:HhH-GPD superfamily base excision DNA repair protein/short chain dehydrogenase
MEGGAPPLDAFGTLVFQVAGQQLSVASTRAIIGHLEERFGGHMPSAAELLAADPQVLRDSGFSVRKGQTLLALAERFVDGRLSDEALARMNDDDVEAALTEVPSIGPWSARGFLLVALDCPDVYLTGDIAFRRAIQRVYASKPVRDPGLVVVDRRSTREPVGALSQPLENKSAIVTGAASGMGAATARELATRGARVLVVDRDEAGARSVAEAIDGDFVVGDVGDAGFCETTVARRSRQRGRGDRAGARLRDLRR